METGEWVEEKGRRHHTTINHQLARRLAYQHQHHQHHINYISIITMAEGMKERQIIKVRLEEEERSKKERYNEVRDTRTLITHTH